MSRVEIGAERFIVKLIERQRLSSMGDGGSAAAEEIVSCMREFAQRLRTIGVVLPDFQHIASLKVENGITVVEVATDGGERMEQFLKRADASGRVEAVRQLVAMLRPVFTQEEPWSVGIDGNLRNFVWDGKRLTYVDFFPPRFRRDGEWLLSYPSPQDEPTRRYCIRRYYTAAEIVRRIIFHLEQWSAECTLPFLQRLEEMLGEHAFRVIEVTLREAPGRRFRLEIVRGNVREAVAIIKSLDVSCFDELRDIALWLAAHDPEVLRLVQLDINLPLAEKERQVEALKACVENRLRSF